MQPAPPDRTAVQQVVGLLASLTVLSAVTSTARPKMALSTSPSAGSEPEPKNRPIEPVAAMKSEPTLPRNVFSTRFISVRNQQVAHCK